MPADVPIETWCGRGADHCNLYGVPHQHKGARTVRPERRFSALELLDRALHDVRLERGNQIGKWGGREADGVENPGQSNYVRLRVLAEEFGEVAEAMGRPEDGNGKGDLRKELIQVAAVCVAWVEGLDDAESLR